MSTKMVIVIRRDLNMRKGKIASQCAHASFKVLLDQMKAYTFFGKICFLIGLFSTNDSIYKWLFEEPFTKIVVSVNSEIELLEIYKRAQEHGIICSLITDSGKTEFKGVPTNTCIAVGPDTNSRVDSITGGLSLL